jgi:hypothetical protein
MSRTSADALERRERRLLPALLAGYLRLVNVTVAVLGVIATAIAAVAAGGSWRAAIKANAAAEAIAEIELARRHEELQPQIRIECLKQPGQTRRALLRLTFEGPPALAGLDEVELRVLDEQWKDRSGSALDWGHTREEIAQTIWGPYRFVPRVDSTKDEIGRTAVAGPIELHGDRNWLLQSVESSFPPQWVQDRDWWTQQYLDQPIRLQIRCSRAGYAPWTLLRDVTVTEAPPSDLGQISS